MEKEQRRGGREDGRFVYFHKPIYVKRADGTKEWLVDGRDYRFDEVTEGNVANLRFTKPINMRDGDTIEWMGCKRWVEAKPRGPQEHQAPETEKCKSVERARTAHSYRAYILGVAARAAEDGVGCGCVFDALASILREGTEDAVFKELTLAGATHEADGFSYEAGLVTELATLFAEALHMDIEMLHGRIDSEKKKRLNLQTQVEQLRRNNCEQLEKEVAAMKGRRRWGWKQ